MRRLILEGPIEEFRKLDSESKDIPIQKVVSLETLHFLRFDTEEFAAICRIELENPTDKLEDVFHSNRIKIIPLVSEKEGTYVCFLKEKIRKSSRDLVKIGVYFSGPCEIKERKAKIGVIGETKQLKAFLEILEKTGVDFRVVSITDAKFLSSSPLQHLTEKQRKVLATAFENGYYNLPRKISSIELAKKLDLQSATLIEHRRKAEYRLLAATFNTF